MSLVVKPDASRRYGPLRVGGWLPDDHAILKDYCDNIAKIAKTDPPVELLPPVQFFKDLIYNDPEVYMLCTEMLNEVPLAYKFDPSHNREIRDVDTLINVLDKILRHPPGWNSSPQIGTPINAILAWPMATTAGFAFFLKDKVNEALKSILQYWGEFLMTEGSCSTLDDQPGNWFSVEALSSPNMLNFALKYDCDPALPHYGFTSWDNFFTRTFRDGMRPVADPDDDNIITSCAESWPFAYQTDVKEYDQFWVKGQPYSLHHMMNGDQRAKEFIGGTVYQAFLSADSYHCWHAPVGGKIVDVKIVPGTYYSEPILYSFKPDSGPVQLDSGADAASQGYISAVAARGLIWIQADNPKIGLMCVIMVGMAEVSSIDVTMPLNQHFNKGDMIGKFHFGGSTHCLIFGPQTQVSFETNALAKLMPEWPDKSPVKVNSKLAIVS